MQAPNKRIKHVVSEKKLLNYGSPTRDYNAGSTEFNTTDDSTI